MPPAFQTELRCSGRKTGITTPRRSPLKEPPNRPQKPPVEEPGDAPGEPPPENPPPVEEPPNEPKDPPIKEPPRENPDPKVPEHPPMRLIGAFEYTPFIALRACGLVIRCPFITNTSAGRKNHTLFAI